MSNIANGARGTTAQKASQGPGGLAARLGDGRLLFLVLSLYFFANLVVRLVLPHGLELDEAEQTLLSQWLLAGYGSQPPLYNWIQYGVIRTFGMSLVTLASLKNLFLIGAYGFYFLAARQVVKDRRLAVIAALGLLTIPQISFEAQRDLSHTVAAIFGASFFLFALLRLLSVPSLASFLLFGLATGIGGISKYNFALLPLAAALAVATDRDMRNKLIDWRMLPAVAVALAIVLPHVRWLFDNIGAASGHTMKKLVDDETGLLAGIVHGLGSLMISAAAFVALALVVFSLAFREQLRPIVAASSPWTRLVGRILAYSMLLIVLMILLAGLENVRDRWLTPILLAAPLYLALKIDASGVAIMPGLARLWGVAAVIMILVPSILFGRVAIDRLTGEYGYVNIPFASVAQAAAEKARGVRAIILASDGQLGGNLHFNLPELPVQTPRPPPGMQLPALGSFDRIVLVWRRADGKIPPSFEETFADYLRQQGIVELPKESAIVSYPYSWGRAEDQYRFGLAVIDTAR